MLKLTSFVTIPVAAFAVSLGVGAGAAQAAVLGPDAASCASGASGAAVLVKVEGFKARTGNLRVQIYGGNPDDFLAKGKKLSRVDLPVSSSGPMEVCVALPKPGNYAVAVRHDVDGNGKSSRNDGGGFSRNPGLSLVSLKPKYDEVVISVGGHARNVPVVLNYIQGLSIKPIKTASR
ncbi:Uncharacterized conserved protein, DUF2141 family [Sphingomonas laterariae]|uniref:Uncharacterized conserved protein, DUF2141 family n=1 Tax=Edaphosphingomonas laterariae TaxID=861865 RepID=A0A239CIW3_9SPHN|nr:DUF2141 domain-containing protein [Sphingomonas laterariae]SNS19899.1 Uncharacterized conserved protein, DUF2141 family [Sphingomonas laterariae]